MKHILRTFSISMIAAITVVATGCTGDSNGNGNGNGNEGSNGDVDTVDEVTYVTGFGLLGRESYVWAAMDQGYFADEGIEIEIQGGSGTEENLALLASGQADFVQADLPGAMIVYDDGDLQDFTIVSAVQQQTLTALMTLEGNGIAAPSDLEGKQIAGRPGSVNILLFPTYANLAGFDESSIEWVDAFPPELPGLLASGAVDAITQFPVGQPLIEQAAEGREAVVLPYSDYLTDLYGGVLAVSTEFAEENPDLVQRFNAALFRGLEYALNDPEGAAEIMATYVDELNPEVAAAEMQLLEPYVQPPDAGAPFGTIDEQRVGRSIALLEAAGAISPGMTPEDLVSFDLAPQG